MSTKDISDAQVVRAYLAAKERGVWPYDVLIVETGQPLKVCLRAMERAYARGYVECGVSLRSGWVEPKGLTLIQEESNGKDD